MKANAFAKVLETYADLCQPQNKRDDWAALADVFALGKTKPVGEFLDQLRPLVASADGQGPGIDALLPDLPLMQATATALGKKPFSDAIEELKAFIVQHPGLSARSIKELQEARKTQNAPRRTNSRRTTSDPTVLPTYNKRLEEALGDDKGFEEVFLALKADKRITASDLKNLAKMFTGNAARNKADALEAIKARHTNLLDARTKSQANAGQTAA